MTDIVSNMDLDMFPIFGMILFGLAFTLIMFSVFKRSKRACEHEAHLPLEDDESAARRGSGAGAAGVNHG